MDLGTVYSDLLKVIWELSSKEKKKATCFLPFPCYFMSVSSCSTEYNSNTDGVVKRDMRIALNLYNTERYTHTAGPL